MQIKALAHIRRDEPRVPINLHHADLMALEVIEGLNRAVFAGGSNF